MTGRVLAWALLVLGLSFLLVSCGGDVETPAATPTGALTPIEGSATPEVEATFPLDLTWWGQSMFVLESPTGANILFDPYGDIGYRIPDPEELNIAFVTVSHEHEDHNNVDVAGAARVLRGLTADGFNPINGSITGGGTIRTVESWHDDSEGSERGRNAIFVVEMGGLRLVHLGDLGHTLSQEQIDAIGPVDVLLVPVGGHFTIDAAGATEVVNQLQPRVSIPMHYKTEWVNMSELAPVDAFLEGKVVEQKGSTVELDIEALPEYGSGVVWVLEPAGARE